MISVAPTMTQFIVRDIHCQINPYYLAFLKLCAGESGVVSANIGVECEGDRQSLFLVAVTGLLAGTLKVNRLTQPTGGSPF